MKQNPRYPTIITSDDKAPLGRLRAALEGKKVSGVRIPPDRAAEDVARLWADTLMPSEQGLGFEFYKTALLSWLTSKKPATKRSYLGTLTYFFDWVSRKRSEESGQLRLVAPHQLRQDDVDAYVAHLARPWKSPEELTDPAERAVYEWALDRLKPDEMIDSDEAQEAFRAEGLMKFLENYETSPGFLASKWRGYKTFDYVISSLARKQLVVKVKTDKNRSFDKDYMDPEESKKEPYSFRLSSEKKPSSISTQIQRLQALSSFWTHMLSTKKLGMSRKPSALEPVDPWQAPASQLAKGKPSDEMRKMERKMTQEDLQSVLIKLAKETSKLNNGFLSLSNVLAARDELAIAFFVSTGLRREEGMMARVENVSQTVESIAEDAQRLVMLSGIRRKGRNADERVFLPRMVLDMRKRLFDMMDVFVRETDAFIRSLDESKSDEEVLNMVKARRRHFERQFSVALTHRDTGPLVPAVGRWGNAIWKTDAKAKERNINLFNKDNLQVPMDGRNLLHRMQLLANNEEKERKYHPHALRHLAVMMAEDTSLGAAMAQAMAGHRSAATTAIYRDMVSLQAAAVVKVADKVASMISAAYDKVIPPAPQPQEGIVQGVQVPEAAPAQEEAPVAVQVVPVLQEVIAAPEAEEPAKVTVEPAKAPEKKRRVITSIAESFAKADAESNRRMAETTDKMAAAARVVHQQERKKEELFTTPTLPPVSVPEGPIQVLAGTKEDAGKKKAEKEKKVSQERFERVFNRIPPSIWFLQADKWNGDSETWRRPVFLSIEQYKGYIADEKIPGPNALSWLGQNEKSLISNMAVSSPRTNLAYRMATNKRGELDVKYSKEEIDLETIPGVKSAKKRGMSKNPAAKSRSKYRLVSLPIINLSSTGWNRSMASAVDSLHEEYMRDDPAAAKSMARWLAAILSSSKDVEEKIGGIHWIDESEIMETGEDMVSSFDKCRMKDGKPIFRQHTVEEVADFLRNEGTTYYQDMNGISKLSRIRTSASEADEMLVAELEDIKNLNSFRVGSFLKKYELPDWMVETDDPIGDPKYGLGQEDMKGLKDFLNAYMDASKASLSFSDDAGDLAYFWDLVGPFAMSEARTVDIRLAGTKSPMIQDIAKSFRRKNQIDPVVGCRRYLRTLWEVHKSGNVKFMDKKRRVNVKAVNEVWGLLWSWILPSSSECKQLIFESGTPSMKGQTLRDAFGRVASQYSFESIFSCVSEAFDVVAEIQRSRVDLSEDDMDTVLLEYSDFIKETVDKIFSLYEYGVDSESFRERVSAEILKAMPKSKGVSMSGGSYLADIEYPSDVAEVFGNIFGSKDSAVADFAARLSLSVGDRIKTEVSDVRLDLSEEGSKSADVRTEMKDKSTGSMEDEMQASLVLMVGEVKKAKSMGFDYGFRENDLYKKAGKLMSEDNVDEGFKMAKAIGLQAKNLRFRLLLEEEMRKKPSRRSDIAPIASKYKGDLYLDRSRSDSFVSEARNALGMPEDAGGRRPKKMTPNLRPAGTGADTRFELMPAIKVLAGIRLSIPIVLFFAYAPDPSPRARQGR